MSKFVKIPAFPCDIPLRKEEDAPSDQLFEYPVREFEGPPEGPLTQGEYFAWEAESITQAEERETWYLAFSHLEAEEQEARRESWYDTGFYEFEHNLHADSSYSLL